MGILDEDVKLVRERSDLVAIASQYTQLKRVGRRMTGLCPFHSEKSGSFSVNAEEGLYKCFGCGVGGDVITFVREMEHLDFVGAVEWLAGKAGVTLRYTDQNEGESRRKRDRLVNAMEQVVDWYHTRLLEAPDAAPARKYLRSRGFTGNQVREYQIGWAPDDWDVMVRSVGLPREVLVDLGVGLVNKRNRLQDFFRGRVLFPIFDAQGRPVSFGGRVMPGQEGAKYMNTRDTTLYEKSRTLYGLNWHKDPIVRAEEVIVCEGYTDVIACAQAGLPRAVATCGTALTADHVRSMKRFAHRIVLAFDADAAGQAAAARVYEWERKFEVDVAVADLPPGVDPADLARTDPKRLASAIEDAIPMLGFRVDRALRSGDLQTPEGRARAAGAALELIAEHPSDLVRDQYLMDVASRCRMTPERLREIAADPSQRRRRDKDIDLREDAPPRRASHDDSSGMELLRLAVSQGDAVFELADAALLPDPVVAEAYDALVEADSVVDAMASVSPAAADLLGQVAVEETDAELEDVVARLLDRSASAALDELEAEARSSDDPLAYATITGWLKLHIESLRLNPDVRSEETMALRDWIIDRVTA
jgi:DNA primase